MKSELLQLVNLKPTAPVEVHLVRPALTCRLNTASDSLITVQPRHTEPGTMQYLIWLPDEALGISHHTAH